MASIPSVECERVSHSLEITDFQDSSASQQINKESSNSQNDGSISGLSRLRHEEVQAIATTPSLRNVDQQSKLSAACRRLFSLIDKMNLQLAQIHATL